MLVECRWEEKSEGRHKSDVKERENNLRTDRDKSDGVRR